MKVLDRYLAWEFIRTFLVVMSLVACLMLVAEIIERLGAMMENNTSWLVAIQYLAASLPTKLLEAVPMATIVAVLFTVGILARNNEILAMMTGGVSIYRIALPLLIVGAVISGSAIAIGEFVAPQAERLANYLRVVHIEGKLPRNRNRDIVASGMANSSLAISNFRYDENGEVMQGITIWWMDPDTWNLRSRMDASVGTYKGTDDSGRTRWEFARVTEISYDFRGNVEELTVHPPEAIVEKMLSPRLNLYLRDRQKPEEMNIAGLSEYIDALQIRGANASAYITNLHMKLAYPLGALVLVLLGVHCGMRAQRGSLVVGFGLGLILAFSFFVASALSRALGGSGLGLPPQIFAWTPLILFTALGVLMLVRTGRPS